MNEEPRTPNPRSSPLDDEAEFIGAKLQLLEAELHRLRHLPEEIAKLRQSIEVLQSEHASLEAALLALDRAADPAAPAAPKHVDRRFRS